MRKILTLLLLALVVPAFGQRVTVTVTVTNRAVTSNSLTIGSSFRYFTNAQASDTFATNLTSINATKTNVFNQIAAFPYTAITLQDVGTNSFRLVASASSLATALGGTWGYITTNSAYGSSNTVPMAYPYDMLLGDTNKTNQASASVDGINRFATNLFTTNLTALGNYLTKGASTQQVVIAPVQFNTTLRAANGFAATNGFLHSVTGISLVTTSLVNYGNAIRSGGPGGNSLQVGSNAWALGSLSVAIGNNSLASNDNAVAVGTSAIATNTGAVAFGNSAGARGDYATAIGSSAAASTNKAVAIGESATASSDSAIALGTASQASGNSAISIGTADIGATAPYAIAIGNAAEAGGSNSIAIGRGATVGSAFSAAFGPPDHLGNTVADTATNQIRLGTDNHHVSIPGQLLISGTQSNTTFRGTNIAGGSWSFPRFDLTTLAAGNNIAVPFGTNRYIRAGAGPASAATICGIIGGATTGGTDGQDVIVFNDTGYSLTFAVNTVDPVPANRISTASGSDVTIIDQGWANLTYDATDSRWQLTATYPTTATATNALQTSDGNATNLTVYGNAKPPLRIWPQTGSVSNRFEVLTTNGAVSAYIGTNGTLVASNMAVTPFSAEVGLPYRLFAITNTVLVTNVTADTEMLSNSVMVGTTTIPANWWTPGRSIQIKLAGRYFNSSTTTFTNWVRLGSTMLATNHSGILSTVSNETWSHDVVITCLTTGASGTFVCNGTTTINNTAGAANIIGRRIWNLAGSATVDTTASQTLGFSMHPGATTQAFYIQHGYALVIP